MGPAVYETEDDVWDAMFNLNVTTLRRVLSVATPLLLERGRGSIVNVGALGALRALQYGRLHRGQIYRNA